MPLQLKVAVCIGDEWDDLALLVIMGSFSGLLPAVAGRILVHLSFD